MKEISLKPTIVGTHTLRDLAVSESGQIAFWSVSPSIESDQYVSELMMMETPESKPEIWTTVTGIPVGLLWTATGSISYAIGKTLWTIREKGHPQVSCSLGHPILEVCGVPNTGDIVCSIRPVRSYTEPQVIKSLPIKQDGRGRLLTFTELVYVQGGIPTKRITRDHDVWHPRVSRDGTRLAYLARESGVRSLLDAACYIVPLDDWDQEPCRIGVPRFVADMAWSLDSKTLSILALDGTIGEADPLQLWRWDEVSGVGEVPLDDALWVGTAGGGDWAYPSRSASPVWLNADEVILTETQAGHVQLVSVDLRSGVSRRLSGREGNYASVAVSRHTGEIFAVYEDASTLHEIVRVSGHVEESITQINSGPYRIPNEYQIPGWQGDLVQTFVLPAEGRQRGTILSIHGGPHGAFSRSVQMLHQTLASDGFTVIYANPHGSIGYSHAYARDLVGHWGERDAEDWSAIVDYGEQAGWLDRSRLGVLGSSYGGFMATWLAGSWPFLRTAVIQAPVVDQMGMFWTSDIGYTFTTYGCAVDLEDPDTAITALWNNSPLRKVPKIHASVLLLHGENDDRCPVGQSEALFTALKLAGKDVEWVLYPAESHLMSTMGRPRTRVDRINRIREWLIERYSFGLEN